MLPSVRVYAHPLVAQCLFPHVHIVLILIELDFENELIRLLRLPDWHVGVGLRPNILAAAVTRYLLMLLLHLSISTVLPLSL